MLECRYMLRQYDASELKKTFSGCGFDCAADDVPSLQKLDLADLPDVVTSDSAKVVIQPKDEDIPCTSVSGPKGMMVINHQYSTYGLLPSTVKNRVDNDYKICNS